MTTTLTDLIQDLAEVRQRTLDLVAPYDDARLEAQLDPIMSPLAWDLGHIAAYEDLWLNHRYGGLPLLREDLVDAYDAFETPRAVRGQIEILGVTDAREYLAAVRDRALDILDHKGPDPVLHEIVLQHELQHTETMRQAMVLAGLLTDQLPEIGDEQGWVEIPAGVFTMGSGPDGFSYDNERPAHDVRLDGFAIAQRPAINEDWREFTAAGGYERRELWSEEGWTFKQRDAIHEPANVSGGAAHAPVCHVSWHEAEAFARFSEARLPTEPQWERAATAINDIGLVWEWTTSEFSAYDGFAAHPYKEYSEVFFDRGYRCLRGGSWATDPRVATRTFRNWDLPGRRQIFAGVRLVREAQK